MTERPTASGFPPTVWSVIVAAGDHGSPHSGPALEQICSGYWRPIYVYVRGRGHSREHAEDLTQGFFERLIEKNYLADFRQERGRFRSFLLAAAKHYLSNQQDRADAVKRGGDRVHVAIDWTEGEAERSFLREPVDSVTPETLFDREWGRTVLARTRQRLQTEMERAGKKNQFDELVDCVTGDDDVSYRQIASLAGMTEGAARVAVHRLRRRFRELLQDEVGQTLVSAEELGDEIRFLFSALSTP
jgi:RNA polymerase sigma-70 factor (ECF subfamily)